ncbi:2-amino-4-hydroxy-6-hydroxymethyldihydropteridine diphosphokinase [Caldithrix abyssi]
MRYFVGLGSNMGDRLQNLKKARDVLQKIGEIERQSPVFKTPPWGNRHQNDFFNAVVQLQCPMQPFRFLRKLKQFETQLGRVKSEHWGPRVIDLDVLEWEGPVVQSDILNIPHPLLQSRDFVLVPLSHIAPDFKFRSGKTITEAVASLDQVEACQLLIENW